MSYSRVRSVPGMLYGLRNNTKAYYPLDFNALGHPRYEVGVNDPVQLDSADLVVVVANEQSVESMAWSLVMYVAGTLDEPAPKLGWIHNDQLQWIPEVSYVSP